MLRKLNILRVFLSIGLIVSLSIAALADTIRLKDGSIIKGKIVSFSGGKFTVAIGEGSRSRQMSFTAAEIESIQFDSPMSKPEPVNPSDRITSKRTIEDGPQIIETSKTVPRVVTTDTVPRTKAPPMPDKPNTTAAKKKPVELGVKVLADNTSNGWTNSGWVVKKGQTIRIIGNGKISLGGGNSTGPSGISDLSDEAKLLKNVPTGALIAVISDDNNEFIYIGAERTFTASRDGALFLGVNEGNLDDNSGAFDVRVEIDPA